MIMRLRVITAVIFGFNRLLLELRELKYDILLPLSFLCFLKIFQLCLILHSNFTFIKKKIYFCISYWIFQIQAIYL